MCDGNATATMAMMETAMEGAMVTSTAMAVMVGTTATAMDDAMATQWQWLVQHWQQ